MGTTTGTAGDLPRATSPIRNLSGYQAIVEHLRREISLGRLMPGDRLPPERRYAEELGVARETLRQALRVLEGSGHIEIRRGSRGGAVIRPLPTDPRVQLSALVQRSDFFRELLEFRQVVETAAASKAARRRSTEDLERMVRAQEALLASRTKEESRKADTEFHLAIAEAAGNEVLRKSIEDARAQMFLPVDLLKFEFVKATSYSAHAHVLDAIREQQADQAGQAMAEHLATTREELDRVLASQPPD